jgi:hypothetical protein
MENDNFKNRIECEFAVITNEVDPQFVTRALGIMPDRFFNKGDLVTSAHSLSIGKRPYGLWAVSSNEIFDGDIDLSKHLEYFHTILKRVPWIKLIMSHTASHSGAGCLVMEMSKYRYVYL